MLRLVNSKCLVNNFIQMVISHFKLTKLKKFKAAQTLTFLSWKKKILPEK